MPRRYARRRRKRYGRRRTYRRRRSYRKRRYRSRRRGIRPGGTAVRALTRLPIRRMPYIRPARLKVALRFVDDFHFTVAAHEHGSGATAYTTFTSLREFWGNGAYEPDPLQATRRCMFWDQYKNMGYSKYYCSGSSIMIDAKDGYGTNVPSFPFSIYTFASRTGVSDYTAADFADNKDTVAEWPMVKWATATHIGGQSRVRMCHKGYTKSIRPYENITDKIATTTANPSANWKWHIYFDSIGGQANIIARVKIIYYVTFFNIDLMEEKST